MPASQINAENFDFEEHRPESIDNYQKVRPLYETFCVILKNIPDQALRSGDVKIASDRQLQTMSNSRHSTARVLSYFAIVDGAVANLPTLRSTLRGTCSIVNSINLSTSALRSFFSP